MWPVKNLLSFYGEADGAKTIRAMQQGKILPPQYYMVFDVSDYSNRLIMAMPSERATMTLPDLKGGWPKDTVTILDASNELGFIPWICRMGGTGLESDSERNHIPMLFSVDRGNQYDIQNTMETLLFSEAVQHAASPRWKKSGPGAENIEVQYGDPQQAAVVLPGQDIAPLQPPVLDEGLMKLSGWVAEKIQKSTIPPILQGGQMGQNRNFAALSMSVQSGMITVDPYKKLAEQWLSDVCIQMLLWVKQGGEPIKAFDKKKDPLSGKNELHVYTLNPDDINEKGMRIDVILEAEIPVDKVQRINGATMMQRLGVSKRDALEAVGETDADATLDAARFEAMEEFFLKRFFDKLNMKDQIEFQTALEQMRAGIQLQAQQATAQMQMQQQQQMQQAQQQQAQQSQFQMPGGGGPPQPGPEASPMTPPGAAGPGVEGQGWNPAEGGASPAGAAPGETFEGQTGMTRGGTEAQ
jgi:hypothetical protein